MLPDVPQIRSEIEARLRVLLKQRVDVYLGAFNEVPRHLIKEGNRVLTVRPDGTTDETELKVASAESRINLKDVPYMNHIDRVQKLDEVAREMAQQISKHAIGTINQAVERVGNVVDAKGKPLDAESVLDMLERVCIDFDEHGKADEMTVLVPPNMNEQIQVIIERLKSDESLKKRYASIMNKKRMEWRDREASRRLVG